MVNDDGPVGLDGLRIEFDDERAVSGAGAALVATLAGRLGLEALAVRLVRLRSEKPGAANAGRKVMALLYAMVQGAAGGGLSSTYRFTRRRVTTRLPRAARNRPARLLRGQSPRPAGGPERPARSGFPSSTVFDGDALFVRVDRWIRA